MRCANSERGCQWTGTVGTLDDHIASCQFALVPCPNKCKGAGELFFIRKHLQEHLQKKCPKRAYKCPHCREKGTFASITRYHDQVCEKKIVACPNKRSGCSLSMKRGKTKEHVSRYCEYTEVACVYESLGCGVRMLRKDRKKHERIASLKHLDLIMTTVQNNTVTIKLLSEENKKLSDMVDLLSEQHKTQSEGEAVVFQLPGYASKKEKNERFYSTPFCTHPAGYKMCIRIYPNGCGHGKGTHVSVFIELLEGRYDNQLHWPFLGTVTVELLNQLGDDNHHRMATTFTARQNMRVSNSIGYTKFLPHSSLSSHSATNTQYLLDDTLYFRVSVKVDNHKPWLVCTDKATIDTISEIKNCKTNDLKFKITKFKDSNAKQLFERNLFYTHPSGYRMCILLYPNGYGDGKGIHVSVFFQILEGHYDKQLRWPFLGTVTAVLRNQLGDNNHHSMVFTCNAIDSMIVGSINGDHKFLPHSSLGHNPATNTRYLLDDTLYFRVSVKVDNHKP